MIELLQYVGFLFLASCAVVGAWIVLLYGFTGVACLWRMRRELDISVREDLELRILQRRTP